MNAPQMAKITSDQTTYIGGERNDSVASCRSWISYSTALVIRDLAIFHCLARRSSSPDRALLAAFASGFSPASVLISSTASCAASGADHQYGDTLPMNAAAISGTN